MSKADTISSILSPSRFLTPYPTPSHGCYYNHLHHLLRSPPIMTNSISLILETRKIKFSENLSFTSEARPSCGTYVDKSATIFLPISNIIINLSLTCFTSKILSVCFIATSILTPPRPKLFLKQNTIYSLSFPIINVDDAPHLLYTKCINLSHSQCLNNFPSMPSQEPTFKLSNLKFSCIWFLTIASGNA